MFLCTNPDAWESQHALEELQNNVTCLCEMASKTDPNLAKQISRVSDALNPCQARKAVSHTLLQEAVVLVDTLLSGDQLTAFHNTINMKRRITLAVQSLCNILCCGFSASARGKGDDLVVVLKSLMEAITLNMGLTHFGMLPLKVLESYRYFGSEPVSACKWNPYVLITLVSSLQSSAANSHPRACGSQNPTNGQLNILLLSLFYCIFFKEDYL